MTNCKRYNSKKVKKSQKTINQVSVFSLIPKLSASAPNGGDLSIFHTISLALKFNNPVALALSVFVALLKLKHLIKNPIQDKPQRADIEKSIAVFDAAPVQSIKYLNFG